MANRVANPPIRTAGVAAEAYRAVALGDGRVRLAWAGAAEPVMWQMAESGDGSPVRLVGLVLPGAVSEAARMQGQASGQSAAIREAAEREADEIRRQASAQSAAIREAAERELAELRAVMEEPAGLGAVVFVAEDLISPAKPVTKPEGQFTNQPASKPRTRPVTGTKGRQARVMRRVAVIMVALVMSGLISSAAEIAVHGLPFFFFRNAGAGAGNSQNLNEDQGPGQPDAPGAHHSSPTSRPSRQATRQPASG